MLYSGSILITLEAYCAIHYQPKPTFLDIKISMFIVILKLILCEIKVKTKRRKAVNVSESRAIVRHFIFSDSTNDKAEEHQAEDTSASALDKSLDDSSNACLILLPFSCNPQLPPAPSI